MNTTASARKAVIVAIFAILAIAVTPIISYAAPEGYILPFAGRLNISTGPRCFLHYGYNAEAIDFSGPWNYAIRASKSGVAYFNWESVGGNVVKMYHSDGLISTYAHLSGYEPNKYWAYRNTGNNGIWVNQGDVIGYMGNSGSGATGVHLHFAVHDRYGNPIRVHDMPGMVWNDGNPWDSGCVMNNRPEGYAQR
ncbi:hypothetical protein CO179_05190 [candidate division WWE3 bacterium CG_4_9_14_3_um_filter_39_7]|uniref:M23ase beta-sheet core domain-containing protein n=1 Tax=candidate division WWE3 bacterium CG_4_9_14_3_um_filter_39_7 TaxID=1975080 RepID=A0A2M7X078_UNCKA|nr:MAG: hypothetical protein CO179_05190 [candidate division WWE3 bacterium CG_4_9_14_3_um_filter_39_7]